MNKMVYYILWHKLLNLFEYLTNNLLIIHEIIKLYNDIIILFNKIIYKCKMTFNKIKLNNFEYINLEKSYLKMQKINWKCPNTLKIYKLKLMVSNNKRGNNNTYEINEIFIPVFGIAFNKEAMFFISKDRYENKYLTKDKCNLESIVILEGDELNKLFEEIYIY